MLLFKEFSMVLWFFNHYLCHLLLLLSQINYATWIILRQKVAFYKNVLTDFSSLIHQETESLAVTKTPSTTTARTIVDTFAGKFTWTHCTVSLVLLSSFCSSSSFRFLMKKFTTDGLGVDIVWIGNIYYCHSIMLMHQEIDAQLKF